MPISKRCECGTSDKYTCVKCSGSQICSHNRRIARCPIRRPASVDKNGLLYATEIAHFESFKTEYTVNRGRGGVCKTTREVGEFSIAATPQEPKWVDVYAFVETLTGAAGLHAREKAREAAKRANFTLEMKNVRVWKPARLSWCASAALKFSEIEAFAAAVGAPLPAGVIERVRFAPHLDRVGEPVVTTTQSTEEPVSAASIVSTVRQPPFVQKGR